jgi:hypothetical protein
MAKSRQDLEKFACREYDEVNGVRLQSLTEMELSMLRSSWGERFNKNKDNAMNVANMRVDLLAASIVDDDGVRIFSDGEASLLFGWKSSITEKLYNAARVLSGLDADDEVDEAEKKSEETTVSS